MAFVKNSLFFLNIAELSSDLCNQFKNKIRSLEFNLVSYNKAWIPILHLSQKSHYDGAKRLVPTTTTTTITTEPSPPHFTESVYRWKKMFSDGKMNLLCSEKFWGNTLATTIAAACAGTAQIYRQSSSSYAHTCGGTKASQKNLKLLNIVKWMELEVSSAAVPTFLGRK